MKEYLMDANTKLVMYAKFEQDVIKRSKGNRILLAFDQLLNVIFWNGSQDETISSHIARRQLAGTATWFDNKVCCVLKRLQTNHCNRSKGE